MQLELQRNVGTTMCKLVKSRSMLFFVLNFVASIFTTSSTLSVVAICLEAMSLNSVDSVSSSLLMNFSKLSLDKKIYSPTSFVSKYSASLKREKRNGNIW